MSVIICTSPPSEFPNEFFPNYNLSVFQKWALKGIVEGDNVLITAHTGSGKTLPAEYAIQHFHQLKKKVIYASPIKALSNQKLYDMRKKYPHISFGLLTGDCKDNPEADVLIMTTEILRNTLFNIQGNTDKHGNNKQSIMPLSFNIDIENDLAAVVFDEVHYINDVDRGSVWEQSILLLPPHVQLIMLSATIDRPDEFASWIAREKQLQAIASNKSVKNMYLVSTNERVVPLTHYMWLAVHNGTINKAAKTPYEKKLEDINSKPIVIADAKGVYNETNFYKVKDILDYNYKNNIYVKRQFVLDSLVRYLNVNNMLPAICFVFSRKHVEQAAKECSFSLFEADSGIPALIDKECKHILMTKLPNYKEYLELPEYLAIVKLLEKGIAIHHAGIMPVLREMIELLFEKGYIKLLFATETFAVGINMPTKTVIFAGLTKFNGQTMRLLYSHEYTQMAGRAGRRGIDTIGHVFHCNNLFELPSSTDYKHMLTGPPQKLTSKFKISFNLALNICTCKHDNILEHFTSKTLLSSDIKNELTHYIKEETVLVEALKHSQICLDLSRTPKAVLLKYKELENALQSTTNSARKKIRMELNALEVEHKFLSKDMKYLEAYMDAEQKIKDNTLTQENNKGYIKSIIDCVENILFDNEFINEAKELSEKGLIASQIQEVHPLMLADTYIETKGFAEFTPIEIAAVFSCFNNINVSDEFKTYIVNDNNSVNDNKVNKIVNFMQKQLDYYYELETKNIINTGSSYDINFDLVSYIIRWCECTNEIECKLVIQDIKGEKHIFLGEFIKAILKINNICSEIEKICEMNGNLSLLEKIKQIPTYTLKYVVTNQSLYI
uniref:Helicase ATP-binding domain-containing protein n=1 Tax=viral metagenome TaxID=1070528 RepID=A0A6C0IH92_9ZZZZ